MDCFFFCVHQTLSQTIVLKVQLVFPRDANAVAILGTVAKGTRGVPFILNVFIQSATKIQPSVFSCLITRLVFISNCSLYSEFKDFCFPYKATDYGYTFSLFLGLFKCNNNGQGKYFI